MEQEASLSETLEKHGLAGLPDYTVATVSIDDLVLDDDQAGGSSRKTMVNNIKTVGVLQNLLVIERQDKKYTVISGTRRLINAREAGIKQLECHIYPVGTDPRYIHIMRLSENMKRSPNWPGQVSAIRNLVNAQVGMTHKEVAKILGINIKTLGPLFHLAELPMPFIYEMLSHRMSKELALKITRLGADDQQKLLDILKSGRAIDPQDVKTLRMSQFALKHTELVEQMPTIDPPVGVTTADPLPTITQRPEDVNWQDIELALDKLRNIARNKGDRSARMVVTLLDQLNSQIETLRTTEVS